MDINTFLIFLGYVAIVAIGLILKSFLPKYMEEKGKNLATKEDLKDITQNTEEVKEVFNKKFAEFSNELQLKLHSEQLVYDNKYEVIKESLEVIDSYLSWNTFYDSDGKNSRIGVREKITADDLTLKARKCYNNLCITCDDIKILDCFLKILKLIKNNENWYELYNLYRNLCRKELRLQNTIDLNPESVFISRVSTEELEKNN